MLLQNAIGSVCVFIFITAASIGFFESIIGVFGVTIIDAAYLLATIWGIGTILERYQSLKTGLNYFGQVFFLQK